MRVLILTNAYPTERSPMFGIFVKQQVDAIRKRGVEADVLFVNGKRSRWEYLRGIARLRRALRPDHDLIHAHYVFSGCIARSQRQVPVVLTHHGIETQIGWQAPLCKAINPLMDRIICVSRRVKAASRAEGAAVIPCGVDFDRFRPIDRAVASAALDLPADRKRVLFCGALRPEKRFDRVEAAMRVLRRQRDDVDLIVAANQPPSVIPLYMNACDALVLTSNGEGSPQVVKEAMACNLPVVSVDVGDVREVVGGTEGCSVVYPNAASLASALSNAVDFGRTAGRAAVQPIEQSEVARRIIEVYEAALKPRQRVEESTAWHASA